MVGDTEGDREMKKADTIVIGITECGRKFENYVGWIEASSQNCRIIRLSAVVQNQSQVDECDGVLLTGGGDIHPRYFDRPELIDLLNPDNVDERRDEFEFAVADRAERRDIPLLGICRGLQVFNVIRGGSIIPDLAAEGKPGHEADADHNDRRHTIDVGADSLLGKTAGATSGVVNSSHHQAVGTVGAGLSVVARSADGVIEALEGGRMQSAPRILVQWHPERLEAENKFSVAVRAGFIEAVLLFSLSH